MSRIPLALLSALAALPAFAATDGTLGSTSTGTLNITATVPQPANPESVRISGLQDIDFGTIDGNSVQNNRSITICIYHSSPTALLSLTPSTPNSDGSAEFRLISASNPQHFIPAAFSLGTKDGSFGSLEWLLQRPVTGNRVSQTCSFGDMRFTFKVELLPGQYPAGVYSRALNLLVAPQ